MRGLDDKYRTTVYTTDRVMGMVDDWILGWKKKNPTKKIPSRNEAISLMITEMMGPGSNKKT